jgi:sporulation-control protein
MGFLSRIGVGSATVDTILETDTVEPGDRIDAHVEIEGGEDDQEVDELELAVTTEYQVPADDDYTYETAELDEMELDGFRIDAGEEWTMDVPPIDIPATTPATVSQTSVWVQTTLEIDWAADPTDRDELTVNPGPHLDALLTAIENLGLVLDFADNAQSRFGPHPFAQFFEYENYGEAPWENLDDIEFFVAPARDHLEVQVDVERTSSGLFSSDESRAQFTVTSTDPAEVQSTVRSVIDSNLD